MTELINPAFLVSTGSGAGVVWAVCKVYFKFIFRDIERMEKRIEVLERRRSQSDRVLREVA